MFGDIIENVSEAVDNTVESAPNFNAADLLEELGDVLQQPITDCQPVNTPGNLDFGNIWESVGENWQSVQETAGEMYQEHREVDHSALPGGAIYEYIEREGPLGFAEFAVKLPFEAAKNTWASAGESIERESRIMGSAFESMGEAAEDAMQDPMEADLSPLPGGAIAEYMIKPAIKNLFG